MRKEFQSTSPCGGRRDKALCLCIRFEISIHVPLRGTTRCKLVNLIQHRCFNPRPLAGDDTSDLDRDAGIRLFQSTSPCGGRHAKQVKLFLKVVVSIHVPLRGTTRSGRFARTIAAGFNPRPLAGDDTPKGQILMIIRLFQSTSPCGGRHL